MSKTPRHSLEEGAATRPGGAPLTSRSVQVPRAWLIGIPILLFAPWLVAGALYLKPAAPAAAAPQAASSQPTPTPSGPWGQLRTTPVVISPPLEYVSAEWGPVRRPVWFFADVYQDRIEAVLTSFGFGAAQAAQLRASARIGNGGLVLQPDPEFVRALDPQVRSRLYVYLSKHLANFDQVAAFRYYGASLDEWFAGARISDETRRLIEPLLYRHGEFMYFADIELVRAGITDRAELQRLVKVLSRQSTLLVSLGIDSPADVDAIAEYWGRGGRRTDIRPLLDSIAGRPGASVDISHLLPLMARQHLYRYPMVSVEDIEKPLLANCLWTALNFFNTAPDDRYLDVEYAIDHLKRDYYVVYDGLQLGDVVAFVNARGNIFHVAVYLADGLVFGKNGTSSLVPWSILPIERLKGHFVEYADEWRVVYHRRKEL